MRYDVYICYFKKCSKCPTDIDVDRCKMYFKFSDLEHDINTMVERISIYQPQRTKTILMTLASLGGMFYLSW